MTELIKPPLFNPYGDDSIEGRKIINGDPTNLNNFNDVKYEWTNNLYRIMVGNFWIPEKVSLAQDKIQYQELLTPDKEGFKQTFSFLTFLDSAQSINLPNITDYITAPEIKRLLILQAYQEVIHSQSYAYVLESVVPVTERHDVLYLWRDYEPLLKRNEYIGKIYQNFIDDRSIENFIKVILANYILESLYFYNGFNYFYNLGYRNLMIGTMTEINYINRDEATHVRIFREIIKHINQEFPGLITQQLVHDMFGEAAEQEIAWAVTAYGDGIPGINKNTIDTYTKMTADTRIMHIGYDPLFGGNLVNPYPHLDRLRADSTVDAKKNFFETTVTDYNMSGSLRGWDRV